MARIELGRLDLLTIDDQDMTPHLAGLPDATITIEGEWQSADDDGFTFPPGSTRIESYRPGKSSFTLRVGIAPWFYRQMTGRKHPRIRRIRRDYRAKRSHW